MLLLGLILLLSNSFAESMAQNEFWIDIGDESDILSPPIMDYVELNVDVQNGDEITASYTQWDCWGGACQSGEPQPNNVLGDWPQDNMERFWIQFVSPSGEQPKITCIDNPGIDDTCTEQIVADEDGIWKVRFGAGVMYEDNTPPSVLWAWGLRNWSITVDNQTPGKGRVWKDAWSIHSSVQGSFSKDFYILAKSSNSPLDCYDKLFQSTNCKGTVFKASFTNSQGYHWRFASNSYGTAFFPPAAEKKYLRESIPLQESYETCLDDYGLVPERYTYENTDPEPEHRIYWSAFPEFFEIENTPTITQGLAFDQFYDSTGGEFSFATDIVSFYEIIIDLDQDGVFDPYSMGSEDIILQGTSWAPGTETRARWSGKTKSGATASPGNYDAKLKSYTEIANFPLQDFERANFEIQKWTGAGFIAKDVFWHDSIAGGSDNLPPSVATQHIWNGVVSNAQTNCYPAAPAVPDLSQTIGDQDIINTWIHGDFDLAGDVTFSIEPVVGATSILVIKELFFDNEDVEGDIIISEPDPNRAIIISLQDALTNAEVQPVPPDVGSHSAGGDIHFNFGQLPEGNYKMVATVNGTPCNPCSMTKYFSVKDMPTTPVPELSFFLVALIALAVLAIASRRK